MNNVNRRSFLKKSLVAGAGLATFSTIGANNNSNIASEPGKRTFTPAAGRRTNNKFGFAVMVQDSEVGRNLYKGYDEIYLPIQQTNPAGNCQWVCALENTSYWLEQKKEILSWGFPIGNSSHFATHGPVVGENVDFELSTFGARRAIARCNEVGIKVCGIFGGFFTYTSGDKRSFVKVYDQALRYVNMLADEAEPYGIRIALEPRGGETDAFPLYLDAVEFIKRLGRWNVGCMVDTAYMMLRNQDFNDIVKYPEYLFSCEMQGVGGQPGWTGDERKEVDTRFFRALRDVGWEGVVDFAVRWHNTSTGPLDITAETRKSLEYVKRIQDQVYAE